MTYLEMIDPVLKSPKEWIETKRKIMKVARKTYKTLQYYDK
ncbi:MAG: hypothetical protein V3T99_06585 [Nitrososphaerales archaeon]